MILLRYFRWKILLLLRFMTRTPGVTAGYAVGYLIALFFFFGLFFGFLFIFKAVAGLDGMGIDISLPEQIEAELLAAAYLGALTVGLFVCLRTAFLSMYASTDLPLLFSAPLRVKEIFILKFIELAGSALLCAVLVALPVSLSYGIVSEAGFYYYILILILTLLLALFIAAISALLNLLVVRIIPPYRIKELGFFFGSMLGALVYGLVQVSTSHIIFTEDIIDSIGGFSLAGAGFSPAWWLARAGTAAAGGQIMNFLSWAALTAAVTAVLLCLSFTLVQKAFYGGWAGSAEARRRVKNKRKKLKRWRLPFIKEKPVEAIAQKELRAVFRNLGEWAQALYMIIIFLVVFFTGTVGTDRLPLWHELGGAYPYYLLAWGYLFTGSLALSMSLGSVAREGRGWFLLGGYPLTVRDFLKGKLYSNIIIVFIPAALLILAINLLLGGIHLLPLVWVFMFINALGLVAVNIAVGSISPNFTAENIGKRVSPSEIILILVLAFIYTIPIITGVAMAGLGAWTGPGLLIRLAGAAILLATPALALKLSYNAAESSLHRNFS